jgi:hypothetical protein
MFIIGYIKAFLLFGIRDTVEFSSEIAISLNFTAEHAKDRGLEV